jgi:formylglycine-generating enzyme required for sulfatase activity
MIGNVWEWTAELQINSLSATTTNTGVVRAIGDGYDNTGDASIRALQIRQGIGDGPQHTAPEIGFRCAR